MIVLRLDHKALADLLENQDDAIRLEITNAAMSGVEAVIGDRVKKIASRLVEEWIRNHGKEIVRREFAELDWYARVGELKPDFVKRIENEVRASVWKVVDDTVKQYNKEDIVELVVERLSTRVRAMVSAETVARDTLVAMVDERTNRTITIEVRGGIVEDVRGLPHGLDYEIVDHDTLEAHDDG
jgi:hypothetical protein